jgi:hypothetical protein
VDILGPPTISQKAGVARQNPNNPTEYWHFAGFWNLRAMTSQMTAAAPETILPGAAQLDPKQVPIENRWFVRRMKAMRGDQLLRIVRAMDDALNNTSVILLFKAGSKKFLFPGDAQWENWEYALSKRAGDLKDVDVYKVGHHGSLNATPKTLWNGFAKRSASENEVGRLCTVMSTRSDSKHGHRENDSEVPRDKLVTELRARSTLRTTQELEAGGDLVLKLDFDLR